MIIIMLFSILFIIFKTFNFFLNQNLGVQFFFIKNTNCTNCFFFFLVMGALRSSRGLSVNRYFQRGCGESKPISSSFFLFANSTPLFSTEEGPTAPLNYYLRAHLLSFIINILFIYLFSFVWKLGFCRGGR